MVGLHDDTIIQPFESLGCRFFQNREAFRYLAELDIYGQCTFGMPNVPELSFLEFLAFPLKSGLTDLVVFQTPLMPMNPSHCRLSGQLILQWASSIPKAKERALDSGFCYVRTHLRLAQGMFAWLNLPSIAHSVVCEMFLSDLNASGRLARANTRIQHLQNLTILCSMRGLLGP